MERERFAELKAANSDKTDTEIGCMVLNEDWSSKLRDLHTEYVKSGGLKKN